MWAALRRVPMRLLATIAGGRATSDDTPPEAAARPIPRQGRAPMYHRRRAPVAQWIEHLTSDQTVGGSNPSGRASVLSRDIGDT
jgi:hypothetical protein